MTLSEWKAWFRALVDTRHVHVLLDGPCEINCRVCGKLCHRHEPGCTVPPGEIGGDR